MRNTIKPLAAALLLAVAPAVLAQMPMCSKEADAKQIQAQQERMEGCMRRMHDAATPADRQKAMSEHAKEMHRGMGYMMGGKHSAGCNGEMMDSMMEQMKQHRSMIKESGG